MKNGNLIKNGSLYIFGNIFNKAIAVITVPLFTRMLTTEEYGVVNTYGSWLAVMSVLVGLSLRESIRNAFVDMRGKLKEFVSAIFTLSALNLVIIMLLCTGLSFFIDIPRMLIYVCVVEAFFSFVISVAIACYTIEEKAISRTLLMVFPNLVGSILAVLIISAMSEGKDYGYIVGFAISTSLFGVGVLLWYWWRYRTFIRIDYWRYALIISVPLIFHSLSSVILGSSDRTIITLYRGAAETGVYSLIYKLNTATSVVTSSAEAVWLPRFIRGMEKRQYNAINEMNRVYIYVVLFAFCGVFTAAPELLMFFGGEEYMGGLNMVFPIVLSAFIMFLYGIYLNVEYYYKKTKMIAISAITAAVLNLVLNLLFIPIYGAVAAAYTTVFSYFISFLLHMKTARMINPYVAPLSDTIIPFFIVALAGIFTYITKENTIFRWGSMIALGVCYSVLIYRFIIKRKNREEITTNKERS